MDRGDVSGTEPGAEFMPVADTYKQDPKFRSLVYCTTMTWNSNMLPQIGEVGKLRMATQTSGIVRHRTFTKTYGVVAESILDVQVVCVPAVALYGSELWWDPKEVGRRDDLQLLLNQQARSILGALPTTPRGALIRESGLTPAPVMLDSRQQRWAARLANAYSSKLREMHKDPSSSTPKHRVAEIKHKQSQRAEGMSWPPPVEEPVVKTILLDDKGTAKRAVQCWATEKEVTVGAAVWMWWTDASRSGNGRVGAAALYIHDNEWRTHRSRLGAGWMEFFNAELWVIGLMPGETVKRRQTRQKNGVTMVAVCNNSQAAIRWTASLELCAGQWIARRINRRLQVLLTHAIATQIHWVLGYLGIPRHKEADCHANLARQTTGRMVIERPYSSALNRDWQIFEGWSAAKAKWVADKCTSTLDTDSMARRGPRDLFQWRAWSCWLPGSTDYSAGMDPLDST